MTHLSSQVAAPLNALAPGPIAAEAAWGSCEILLQADRMPSLHTGSTHKVYQGWRLAAAMQHGAPERGEILFSILVDPVHPAANESRYALTLATPQDASNPRHPAVFSWLAASHGASDPFAAALAQACRNLETAGWTQNAASSTLYEKAAPLRGARREAWTPPTDATATGAGAGGAENHGGPQPDQALLSVEAPEPTGLDSWETDGGTSGVKRASSPLQQTPTIR